MEHLKAESRLCMHCGYDLQRLTAPRCPECGRTFDPTDDQAFATANECGYRHALGILAAPIGTVVLVFLAAAFGMHPLVVAGVVVPFALFLAGFAVSRTSAALLTGRINRHRWAAHTALAAGFMAYALLIALLILGAFSVVLTRALR